MCAGLRRDNSNEHYWDPAPATMAADPVHRFAVWLFARRPEHTLRFGAVAALGPFASGARIATFANQISSTLEISGQA
jgi:hypothetical protein